MPRRRPHNEQIEGEEDDPGSELRARLESEGILVMSEKDSLLAEEAPEAYKDVSRVVDVCEGAGLSRKVAMLKPMGVLKG